MDSTYDIIPVPSEDGNRLRVEDHGSGRIKANTAWQGALPNEKLREGTCKTKKSKRSIMRHQSGRRMWDG